MQQSQDKDKASYREKDEKVVMNDLDMLPPKKKKLEEDSDFIKHPYSLKPTAPITINITVIINENLSFDHYIKIY